MNPRMRAQRRAYPDRPTEGTVVESINSLLDTSEIQRNLEKLETFHNRHYQTYGAESALWLFEQMNGYVTESGRTDVFVELFKHSWAQPSIIAKITGRNQSLPIIIIGAHQDSINHNATDKPQARAPGADDDGSGTVTVLDAFKALLQSGYRPQRPVEFHLYAAEEVGLLGSLDVAQYYAARGAQVYAMLQMDMNGFCEERARTSLFRRTSVDEPLTNFLAMIIGAYSDMAPLDGEGSFNSDHGAWTRSGYPASHCKEAGGYPWIHTAQDLSFRLDFGCMAQFSRICIGFLVELDLDV
eukprot:367688_1